MTRITSSIASQQSIGSNLAQVRSAVEGLDARVEEMELRIRQLDVLLSNILTKLAARAS